MLLVFTSFVSCERDDYILDNLTDGFSILLGDKYILGNTDIEYYDYSTHIIYLKNSYPFLIDLESGGGFKVFAGKKAIYSGLIHPAYSSWLPSYPVIHSRPFKFQDHIISIDYIHLYDSTGNLMPDIREDDNIVKALKKYDQYRDGLSVNIESFQYLPESNRVIVKLHIQNNDSFKYYILDPEKTGTELFHYFTHGLVIRDYTTRRTYTHRVVSNQPEPWDSWKMEWLSVIESKEARSITLTYNSFDTIPSGEFKAFFKFPGLTFQVKREDIQQKNGRIWLGEINSSKEIKVE